MKNIILCFENCEGFNINCESITYDIIDKNNNIDNVKIIISNSEDGIFNNYGCKQIKFDRIMRYDDIVSIIIDDVEYNVKWYYENEYDCPQNNDNQQSYIDDNGNMIINISSAIGYNKNRINKFIKSLNTYMNKHIDMQLKDIINKFDCANKDDMNIIKSINNELYYDECEE